MTTPIPSPRGLPIIGNAFDIDGQNQLQSMKHLADIYGTSNLGKDLHNQGLMLLGPIFELRLPAQNVIVISNHELFDEISNEKRFTKTCSGPLKELRPAIHDGLFTAYPNEHNWGVAHRILMPSFGPMAIRGMFDG